MKNRLKPLLLVLAGVLTSSDVIAQNFIQQNYRPESQLGLGAMGSHTLAGLYQSIKPSFATLVSVRLPKLISNQDIEIGGGSSGKYSEIAAGPSFHLLGHPPELDPSTGHGIEIMRVPSWSVVSAMGFGFFVQSTRTLRFDLPALLIGLLANIRFSLLYSIDDSWQISVFGSAGLGFAASHLSLNYSLGAGPAYRF